MDKYQLKASKISAEQIVSQADCYKYALQFINWINESGNEILKNPMVISSTLDRLATADDYELLPGDPFGPNKQPHYKYTGVLKDPVPYQSFNDSGDETTGVSVGDVLFIPFDMYVETRIPTDNGNVKVEAFTMNLDDFHNVFEREV